MNDACRRFNDQRGIDARSTLHGPKILVPEINETLSLFFFLQLYRDLFDVT